MAIALYCKYPAAIAVKGYTQAEYNKYEEYVCHLLI